MTKREAILAFAEWSPCVNAGSIICDDCPSKDISLSDGEMCDMYHGRHRRQLAFEAGWARGETPDTQNMRLRARIDELEANATETAAMIAMIDRECSLCKPYRTLPDRVQGLIHNWESATVARKGAK
jgi:hypothetical protein